MKSRCANVAFEIAASCLSMTALTASAHGAWFMGLGDLPGGDFKSSATGVSSDGSFVVGQSDSAYGGEDAFSWTRGGGMTRLLDVHNGPAISPYGLSADGSVVVGYGGVAERWTSGDGTVSLGGLPGGINSSSAYGVSADGSVIVGSGRSQSANYEAFRWTSNAGIVGLGDLPGGNFFSIGYAVSSDGSVVAGVSSSAAGTEAFRWTSGEGMIGLGDLSGGTFYSLAFGISADGSVIVGYSNSSSFGEQASRWTTSEGMVGLGYLPGEHYSYATSISANGWTIVGVSSYSSGSDNKAFIWDPSNGMRSLKSVLLPYVGSALDGWTLTMPNAISADGLTVVGMGTNPDGQREAWVAYLGSEVPAPASWMLVGIGVTGMFASRRTSLCDLASRIPNSARSVQRLSRPSRQELYRGAAEVALLVTSVQVRAG
jgi:probable HAF family extracellular repeat protein